MTITILTAIALVALGLTLLFKTKDGRSTQEIMDETLQLRRQTFKEVKRSRYERYDELEDEVAPARQLQNEQIATGQILDTMNLDINQRQLAEFICITAEGNIEDLTKGLKVNAQRGLPVALEHRSADVLATTAMLNVRKAFNEYLQSIKPALREEEEIIRDYLSEISPEQLAKEFHIIYERLAPRYGYETKRESRTDWEKVPKKNRDLMIATSKTLLEELLVNSQTNAHNFFSKTMVETEAAKQLRKNLDAINFTTRPIK